jgi:Capsule assembly protein Wzi
MRIKFFILLVIVGLLNKETAAQYMPVGMPFYEDALRRAQLLGKISSDVSFAIRPVNPIRAFKLPTTFGLDSVLFPVDTLKYSRLTDKRFWKKRIQYTILPLYTHTQYNGHHPYGWSDGIRIPNKGLQQYVSGGVYLKLGPLELQVRPEAVWAQNSDFQNPPYRAQAIDNPDRMGTEQYRLVHPGQSYAKLNLGPIAVGYSTENIWWGPGMLNSIVFTNNAPGFRHATIHTNRPIKSRYGTFEGQMVCAQLERSGFHPYPTTSSNWPPISADIRPVVSNSKFHTFVNAMNLSYQPKWTPGLFLGVIRMVQAPGEPRNFSDFFKIIYLGLRGEQTGSGPTTGGMNRNQIVSFYSRYLFKESHAEIYFEVGREDSWWDLEDLITSPAYSSAWMAGMRKMYVLPGKDRWLQVYTEMTKMQAPVSNYSRSFGYSFYTGGYGFGWTHKGQVLGAGIGPGSNMNTAGFVYGKGMETFGFHAERVVYNEDMLYTRINYLRLNPTVNPMFIDDSKHYVDWGFMFTHHTQYGKFNVGYRIHLMRTYNFQWNYDPYGGAGPFRYSGLNAWSVNADVSLVYRF